MKNRYKVLYALLLSLFISCKLYENKKHDKREETAMDWKNREQHQLRYIFRQDTLSNRWYFWTDGAFRFHVDSGLFAQSGTLLFQGSERSTSKYMQDLTEKSERGKQKEVNREKSSTKMLSLQHFWIAGSFLLLFLLWRWGRSRLLH